MDNRPVGVYDSGLGGLTVWREIRRQLPEESLVYLGDGKNCPYGSRPREEVRRLADEAVEPLAGVIFAYLDLFHVTHHLHATIIADFQRIVNTNSC